MTVAPDWFWAGLIGPGVAMLVGGRIYAAHSRRKAFQSAAMALGLNQFLKARPISRTQTKKFNLFSRGNSGKWINIWSNEHGTRFLFDFHYVFGIPLIAARRYAHTVAAFSTGITALPDFQLTPATWLDRIAPKLGFKAIRSDRRPEFGKRYWLRSDQEFEVGALFRDGLIDQLALLDTRAQNSIEKGGDWLIVYRHGTQVNPAFLVGFWQNAERLASLFIAP